MSIFKKSIKYSKPSKNINEKIKNLDEGLKKTGVIPDQNNYEFVCLEEQVEENIPKIYDEVKATSQEEQLFDWRKSLLEEHQTELVEYNKEDDYSDTKLSRVEGYISESNKELILLRDQIFKQISEETLLNLPEIKGKISRVLEIYEELQEGLLNEPPETKNEDPLTPLNQNFVTLDDLNKHYTLFINRVQEQLATIGGGGETKLKYLDDIVGIATNPSAYHNKFLKYNHTLGKFEFVTVSGGGGGSQTLDDTLILGNQSTLGIDVGISTFNNSVVVGGGQTSLVVNGDVRITGILTIGTNTVTINGNNSQISVGASISLDPSTGYVTAERFYGELAGVAFDSYTAQYAYVAETALTADAISPGSDLTGIGSVTATAFFGDGSGLSGVVASEGNAYYVTVDGSDSNSGTSLGDTFLTIKHALSLASSGDIVRVGVGTFTEEFPLTVPQGVTVRGMGLRATLVQPTEATKTEDCFLMNGETTVEDLTVANMYEPGYAFRFAPGMKTSTRSPYIQRVTVLNRGTNTSLSDPYGFDTVHNPPVSYKAGRGILIDGSVVDPTTLEPAMLFNECTFICPNNTALEMTNGARTEWVNCFSYFADKGIYAYSSNVGLGSTGKTRIKVTGISTSSEPQENDLLYYFDENVKTASYARVGTAVTVTYADHNLTNNDQVYINFTSGGATDDDIYVISGVTTNTFNLTTVGSGSTTGGLTYKKALGIGTINSYSGGTFILNGKGTGVFQTASSRSGKTVTPFNEARISTVQYRFGTASAVFDGTGDYLQVISDTAFGFGTDDFTLECFIRLTASGATETVIDLRDGVLGDNAPVLYIASNDTLRYYANSSDRVVGVTTLSTNTWYHVAVSRSSGQTRLFLNGTQEGSTYSDSNNYGVSKPIRIGSDVVGLNGFTGYIDEIRISNSSRYDTNFITPNLPFISDQTTKLLLHCDGDNDSVVFLDSTLVTQDVRVVASGIGSVSLLTATTITLADYQQFGAEMRSIGSASVFGNTGVTCDGLGVKLRMFGFNFGHIGSGKDFSQDESLVNQEAEVTELNGGRCFFVSTDQSGNFRVGNYFYVNEDRGVVGFGGQTFNISSLSNLDVTDGVNTTSLTPTSVSVGNLQLSGNQITSSSGNIIINPSGISSTTIDGALNLNGNLYTSGSLASFGRVETGEVRFGSVSEKTTLVSGPDINISYGASGSNIAICNNPSTELVLNVNNIPTDVSFDNHSVLFTVIVNSNGVAYGCTAVNLNGVQKPILWAGGSIYAAGITTTNGYNIYNFTGINTVGSASTTDNYIVLGTVGGGFH